MRVSFGLCAAGLLTPLLLGKEDNIWRMSVEAPEDLLDKIGQASSSYDLADLRSLMPELSTEELAVAGHAVALSNWHQVLHLTTSAPASKTCICCTSRKRPSGFCICRVS